MAHKINFSLRKIIINCVELAENSILCKTDSISGNFTQKSEFQGFWPFITHKIEKSQNMEISQGQTHKSTKKRIQSSTEHF